MKEKTDLINFCISLLETKISEQKQQIRLIQESANNETKSSAGDKYETARAMAQIEMDKYQRQIWEHEKTKQLLINISQFSNFDKVRNGALVTCSNVFILIAGSMGEIFFENNKYLVVSAESPLAKKMLDLKVGDHFDFLNNQVQILALN